MTTKILTSGLCINCFHADECGYCANHTKPIIFCEEFACTDPSESNSDIAGADIPVDYPMVPRAKGICCNCETLETCNLQKTGDAIMNCEEYR